MKFKQEESLNSIQWGSIYLRQRTLLEVEIQYANSSDTYKLYLSIAKLHAVNSDNVDVLYLEDGNV